MIEVSPLSLPLLEAKLLQDQEYHLGYLTIEAFLGSFQVGYLEDDIAIHPSQNICVVNGFRVCSDRNKLDSSGDILIFAIGVTVMCFQFLFINLFHTCLPSQISLAQLGWGKSLFSLFEHHPYLLCDYASSFNPLWLPAFPGIVSKSLAVKALYPILLHYRTAYCFLAPKTVHRSFDSQTTLMIVDVIPWCDIFSLVLGSVKKVRRLFWITVFLRNGLRLRSNWFGDLFAFVSGSRTWYLNMVDAAARSAKNVSKACDMRLSIFLSCLTSSQILTILVEVVETIEHSLALVKSLRCSLSTHSSVYKNGVNMTPWILHL
ncbi:hypothetical protein Tco_0683590 [Tanacetum coccineum]